MGPERRPLELHSPKRQSAKAPKARHGALRPLWGYASLFSRYVYSYVWVALFWCGWSGGRARLTTPPDTSLSLHPLWRPSDVHSSSALVAWDGQRMLLTCLFGRDAWYRWCNHTTVRRKCARLSTARLVHTCRAQTPHVV